MPERLHPGVYVEEVGSGPRPIEGVSTSTAAFVGEAPRGVPGVAHFCTSFADFERALGGFRAGEAGFLAQAVSAFFEAGGRRCYAVRVLPDDAARGFSSIIETRGTDGPAALRFRARGRGQWSRNLRIDLGPASNFPDQAFKVTVRWVESGSSRVLEEFDDLRMDPQSEDYVGEIIEERSRYVQVEDLLGQYVDDPNHPDRRAIPISPTNAVLRTTLSGDVILHEGARLVVKWWDEGAASAPPTEQAVEFVEGANITADGSRRLAFVNRRATVSIDDLRRVLTRQLPPAFTVGGTGGSITIEPNLRQFQSLTVDAAPTGGWDFSAVYVDVTLAGVTQRIEAADFPAADAVSTQNLLDALLDRFDQDVEGVLDGTDRIVLFSAPNPDTSTADAPVFDVRNVSDDTAGTVTDLTVTAVAVPTASTGAPPTSLDNLRVAISEVFQVAVEPQLRSLGFNTSARGYGTNNSANPIARPQEEDAIRLAGGFDGTTALDPDDYEGNALERTGLHALDQVDVNIVALPGMTDDSHISKGIAYCDNRGDCFFVADGPGDVDRQASIGAPEAKARIEALPIRSSNAAMYYPWIEVSDPVGIGRNPTRFIPPSGHIAGVFARTDVDRGVWKAPAGLEASIPGALDLQYQLVDAEQDLLNPVSLNCLRQFPGTGIVCWGTRTLATDPQWRYVPVRRTALFLKESLRRGMQWAVFEPNDEELWARIETNIRAFMLSLFREGAFQGSTPNDAFRVACNAGTNPQERIDQGIVTAEVAFAPLKPAEFVVIQISQKTLVSTN